MLESRIEREVSEYAKGMNWKVYKFTSPMHRGVPDRIFIGPGVVLFIEFKANGRKPTKLQAKTMNDIETRVGNVHVIDNIEDGKKLINRYGYCD